MQYPLNEGKAFINMLKREVIKVLAVFKKAHYGRTNSCHNNMFLSKFNIFLISKISHILSF